MLEYWHVGCCFNRIFSLNIKQQMRKFGLSIIGLALFSAVANLLMLTGPIFMLQVYDRVLTSASIPTLAALISIVGILYLFLTGIDWIRARLLTRVARVFDESMAQDLFRLNLSGEKELPPGSKLFSPFRDLDSVRNFMAGPAPLAFFDFPWVPIYIALIFVLHSALGFFSVASAVILICLMLCGRVMARKPQSEATIFQEAAHTTEQEARNSDAVKAMAVYLGLSRQWADHHDKALSLQQKASDRGSFFSSLTKSVRLFLQSGILAIGAWLVIHQEISAGTIIAAAIILSRGLAPIEQLLTHWQSSTVAFAAWTRLRKLGKFVAAPKKLTVLPPPKGSLSVNNMSCMLPTTPIPLLRNISFKLEPGDILGVVGPSGVGKSVLLRSIVGIYPHIKGEIRLDGATLDQWERSELAQYLGYVPQENFLITGTVAQNISRFQTDAPSEQIVEAAELAQVHELILSLPQGYNTVVGPRGLTLSSGQRQRIALACAFFRRPRLVVLDEPNSNLDAVGDHALSLAVREMQKYGTTIIVATHKPTALAWVEKVLVLCEGRQVAFGERDKVLSIQPKDRFSVVKGGTVVSRSQVAEGGH